MYFIYAWKRSRPVSNPVQYMREKESPKRITLIALTFYFGQDSRKNNHSVIIYPYHCLTWSIDLCKRSMIMCKWWIHRSHRIDRSCCAIDGFCVWLKYIFPSCNIFKSDPSIVGSGIDRPILFLKPKRCDLQSRVIADTFYFYPFVSDSGIIQPVNYHQEIGTRYLVKLTLDMTHEWSLWII